QRGRAVLVAGEVGERTAPVGGVGHREEVVALPVGGQRPPRDERDQGDAEAAGAERRCAGRRRRRAVHSRTPSSSMSITIFPAWKHCAGYLAMRELRVPTLDTK